ncbi:MAG: mechanosensitive ion channel family protein [Endomicrobiales bacterium]|nr:mechanosensitive ion channel family protein [Endomicrobiales bacterium]
MKAHLLNYLQINWIAMSKVAAIVLFSVFVGYIFKKIIFAYFTKVAKNTKTQLDDIVIATSGPHIIFWSMLIGSYFAFSAVQLPGLNFPLINKALISLWIISATLLTSNFTALLIKTYTNNDALKLPSSSLIENTAKIVIIALGVLMLLSHLGVSIAPLLTALGVGSLAVALALQETLSNLFAGFHILASKQILTGDYIKTDGGQEGVVLDIGWRSTRIKQLNNNIVIIPNSKLASSTVVNFDQIEREMAASVDCSVSYTSNLDFVEKVALEVASQTIKALPDALCSTDPVLRFTSFGDSAISFKVVFRIKQFSEQYLLTHEFIKRLHKRFNQENIEIPFPQRVVYLKKEV